MIRIRASLLMVSALLLIAESSHASSASSISCANGLTPSITGYTTSGPSGSITGVPPVATPVEACAAWWSYRGYEARYQDIGLTWRAMTTGDGPSFSVLKNTPLYTVWGVASGWSCDQRWLSLGTPEVQTCPDTSCFGQMGVTPVLKCAVGNSPRGFGSNQDSRRDVHSEFDEFIKREHAEHLARSIPNAEFILLPGVSHFAPLQRPEQFNEALLTFLGKVFQ